MPKKVPEFKIPDPIEIKKISNLEIPIYGFVFQSEEEAWELAFIEYTKQREESKSGVAPNFTLYNKIATAILAARVDSAWTFEEVTARIPHTFAEQLYNIVGNERAYEAIARKKEEEAPAQVTLESLSLPIGEESDTN